MKKFLIEEKKPLIIIFSLFIATFVIMWGHFGDLIIDNGREAYIPWAITQGKALYKDIFCIYGPLPYLVNALAFKLFGAKLCVLRITGGILSALYLLGIYVLSRQFLTKSISTSLTILVIYAAVLKCGVFNFVFPYSYSMIYATVFSIWMMVFLIRYLKDKNLNDIKICTLLAGGICVSKIELIPVIILPFIAYLIFDKNKKNTSLPLIGSFIAIPAVTYLILFMQGVRPSDLILNGQYILKMLNSESLKFFYSHGGNIFKPEFYTAPFLYTIVNIFTTALLLSAGLYAVRSKSKIIKYGLSACLLVIFYQIYQIQEQYITLLFVFLPSMCLAAALYLAFQYLRSKNYKNSLRLSVLFLFIFALLGPTRNFLYFNLQMYAIYTFAPLMIAFVWFLNDIFENNFLYNTKKHYNIIISTFLIILALVFSGSTTNELMTQKYSVATPSGKMINPKLYAQPMDELLSYLEKHSDKDDSLVVYPEGIMINFLSKRSWDFYPTSFIPLDFETFGEEKILNDLIEKKPQYVIFTMRNTSEYGKKAICRDYGVRLCNNVLGKYEFEAAFGDKFRIYLFKHKGEAKIEQ